VIYLIYPHTKIFGVWVYLLKLTVVIHALELLWPRPVKFAFGESRDLPRDKFFKEKFILRGRLAIPPPHFLGGSATTCGGNYQKNESLKR